MVRSYREFSMAPRAVPASVDDAAALLAQGGHVAESALAAVLLLSPKLGWLLFPGGEVAI